MNSKSARTYRVSYLIEEPNRWISEYIPANNPDDALKKYMLLNDVQYDRGRFKIFDMEMSWEEFLRSVD